MFFRECNSRHRRSLRSCRRPPGCSAATTSMPSDGMKRLVVESEVLAVMLQLHAQLLAMAGHRLHETRGASWGRAPRSQHFEQAAPGKQGTWMSIARVLCGRVPASRVAAESGCRADEHLGATRRGTMVCTPARAHERQLHVRQVCIARGDPLTQRVARKVMGMGCDTAIVTFAGPARDDVSRSRSQPSSIRPATTCPRGALMGRMEGPVTLGAA